MILSKKFTAWADKFKPLDKILCVCGAEFAVKPKHAKYLLVCQTCGRLADFTGEKTPEGVYLKSITIRSDTEGRFSLHHNLKHKEKTEC